MQIGRADVAKVDLPDLLGAEVPDHLFRVLAGELSPPLEPGAAAQADPDVRAVGDLESPLVPLEVAEDAPRDAGEHRNGRVVRMDPNPDTTLLGNRDDLLDEVGVI